MNGRTWISAAAIAVALVSGVALADNRAKEPELRDDRPWAKGVSEAKREEAIALFRRGNELLKDSVFVKAAATYRQALAAWDHPAIHYNLVLALLNLDQPEEVYEHLEAAMKYGPAPIEQDKFEQAKAYKNLVAKQLSELDVRCDVAGATVTLDGRPLFTAPGHYQGRVRAGPHSIVASAAGYMTNEVSRTLVGDESTALELKLYRSEDLVRYKRAMPVWLPWTVLAGGVAVAAGGGALHLNARDQFKSFDAGISGCGGCVPDSALQQTLARGNQFQTIALGGYALGGAMVVTGAALALFNQPEAYRVTTEELEKSKVSVLPLLAPGAGGLSATVSF